MALAWQGQSPAIPTQPGTACQHLGPCTPINGEGASPRSLPLADADRTIRTVASDIGARLGPPAQSTRRTFRHKPDTDLPGDNADP